MGIIAILNKCIEVIITDINTPESFKIGKAFEDYVRKRLFIDRYYDLIEKTHTYQENRKDFVYSSLNPDYKFRDKWDKREFYVEAKFRSGIYQNKIIWCNEKQLLRYQQINKTVPVFLILGVGNDPSYPEALSLIPLSQAKYTGLFLSVVERFEIQLDRAITSKNLWNR